MLRVAALVVLTMACHREPRAPTTPIANTTTATASTVRRPPSDQATQLYANRCAICHGNDGGGDGPAASTLDPKPSDYRLAAWQASVTDDELRAIIVGGGTTVGKSALMPGSPDLKDQPELVEDLVSLIRSFAAR